jgi:transposase
MIREDTERWAQGLEEVMERSALWADRAAPPGAGICAWLAAGGGAQERLRSPESGKYQAPGVLLGNAKLQRALWRPTIIAVRVNSWLRAYHQRLLGAGKRPKVALVACMRKLLTAVLSVACSRRRTSRKTSNQGGNVLFGRRLKTDLARAALIIAQLKIWRAGTMHWTIWSRT